MHCSFSNVSRWKLNFTTLLANSADNKLVIFFLFFTENRIEIMHIVSIGDICMKCQLLFSRKNKKNNFNMLSAENFTQSAKC